MDEMTAKERAKECMRFRYAACLSEELTKTIIDAEAARQVLDHYGLPTTPEGREARESMESRRRAAASYRAVMPSG